MIVQLVFFLSLVKSLNGLFSILCIITKCTNKVQTATSQKYLGLVLDSKLDFNEHMSNKINKCNKVNAMK